jgi:hypothetical protein
MGGSTEEDENDPLPPEMPGTTDRIDNGFDKVWPPTDAPEPYSDEPPSFPEPDVNP